MKTNRTRIPRPVVAGLAGLAAAFIVIGGAAYFLLPKRLPQIVAPQIVGESPNEAIAALSGAMDRADATTAMRYIDNDALFEHFFRYSMAAELGKPLTDEQMKPYAGKLDPIRTQGRQAILHGITTQADKDGATPGSLLYALVHLKDGKLEMRDKDQFVVRYDDGSSLSFVKRGGSWAAVAFDITDAQLQQYRKTADDLVKTKMKASLPAGQPSGAPAGAQAGG